jgi:hypothetical protein
LKFRRTAQFQVNAPATDRQPDLTQLGRKVQKKE